MKINKKAAALSLVVLAGALAALFLPRSPTEKALVSKAREPGASDGGPCALREGERVGFDMRVRTTGKLQGDALGAKGVTMPLDQELALELHARVLSSDIDGAVLLTRAAHVEPAAYGATIGAPFLLRLASSCELVGFARHGETSAESGRAAQALAYELNLRYAAPGNESSHEADASVGHYRARYRASEHDGKVKLEQTARSYARIWTDPGKSVTPSLSTMTAMLGAGPWLAQLSRREVLSGVGANDTDTTVEVSRIESPEHALAGADSNQSAYIWQNLLPRVQFPRSPRRVTKRDLAAREAVKNQPIEEALAGHVVRSRTVENFAEIWPPLTTYLEARPEQTQTVVAALRNGTIPPEGLASGWVAIGQARTPEALDALLGVMRDPSAAAVNRTRAMFGLVDRDDIDPTLASELASNALNLPNASNDEERLFARESALAMGMMGNLQEERKPELHAAAVAAIPKLLAAPRNADDLHPVFGAIANLGAASTLSLVEPYTRDKNPKVREGAAQSFRRMRAPDYSPMLANWLAREDDLAVRRELYATLAKQVHDRQESPGAQVLDQAIRDLKAHPGVITRRALVKVLGVGAKTYEPARQALMVQAKKEAELRSGLYAVITQYLGADALLAGLTSQGAAP